MPSARWGQKMGDVQALDMMLGALNCPFGTGHMGVTAENVAAEHQITREAQDAFALESQKRAAAAIEAGRFDDQIVAVEVMVRREKVPFRRDEHPKATTAEALAGLRPAFRKDGSVTAGNASGINDGAAALVLARAEAAETAGLKAQARILGYAHAGVRPEVMGIGPIPAVQRLMERTGLTVDDFDVIEFERGVRGAGAGGQPGPGARPGEGEPERRRHRPRPPGRRDRGDPRRQGHRRAGADGRAARARHHVHRRRPGHRAGAGAGVNAGESASVARVAEAARQAGLAIEIVTLPVAAKTARLAAEAVGCDVAQIANSLVFAGADSGRLVLLLSSGARRVDLAKAAAAVGEPLDGRIRRASAPRPGSPSAAWRLSAISRRCRSGWTGRCSTTPCSGPRAAAPRPCSRSRRPTSPRPPARPWSTSVD